MFDGAARSGSNKNATSKLKITQYLINPQGKLKATVKTATLHK